VGEETSAQAPGGDRERVRGVLGSDPSLIYEPQERLVDETRGAQRVAIAFTTKLPPGDRPELVVKERDELLPRGGIAAVMLEVLGPHHSRSPCRKGNPSHRTGTAMIVERLVPATIRTLR